MKHKKTIETISRNWDRKLWGFYDLQVTNGHKETRAIQCFFCHHTYKGELQLVPAGTAACGFSYKCSNCYASFDAAMAEKTQPNESSFWAELDSRERQRIEELIKIEERGKY